MAGADPTGAFNATTFRASITAAMTMATPNDTADAPTFRWVSQDTYPIADPAGQPYDWTEAPSVVPTPIADLQVSCAVQMGSDSESGTEAGEINQVAATITLLDTAQEALVAHGGRMPDQVLLNQVVYSIDWIAPPVGLFTVDVFTLYCSSIDSDASQ